MKEVSSTINVSGVNGSAINIHSSGATAKLLPTLNITNLQSLLKCLRSVKGSGLDETTTQMLMDNVNMLATSHKTGTFSGAYKDFMQNVSAHITVFAPFIAGLSALL
ncbi:hypothetical protein [Photobacterium leiognathi]|uniref:hypothetical protein n=1 Tax=Photobacterium leiognathi TaxID=553611 RepID=UPI00273A3C62|nr:hypothetical protein [Photobacterium leiognathi]